MVRKMILVATLWLVVAGGLGLALWRQHGARLVPIVGPANQEADLRDVLPSEPDDALADDGLDPALASLLPQSAKGDGDRTSPFFTALAQLARKHGLTLDDYDPTRDADEGYALRRGDYVVVVLRGDSHCIPGDDTQTLLLCGRDGTLLDMLSCAVNNRLTRWVVNHKGVFRTEAPQPPEKDGAQFIIRYVPDGDELSGNWSHSVAHGGGEQFFAWGPGPLSPGEWASKGLCRVAVRGGKFAVLFPKLKESAGKP